MIVVRNLVLISTLFFIFLGLAGCNSTHLQSTSTALYSSPPTYTELSTNIFEPKCLSCHATGVTNLSSLDSLMASGKVVAGNAEASILYQQVKTGAMPSNGAPLATEELQAIYDWITSGASNTVPTTIPDPATSLAVAANSQTELQLTWSLPSQAVTSILIERATAISGPFESLVTLTTSLTTFLDSSLAPASTYYYRIVLSNSAGASPVSAITSGSTLPYPPQAPSSLSAVANSPTTIALTWVDSSSDETNFTLERSTSASSNFATIATLAANATDYSDSALNASTTYYYRLVAINSGGASATATTNATTQAIPTTAPTAPSGLTALALSASQIELNWTDNSPDETGFKIERAASAGGTYALVATTAASVTSFSDDGLLPATAYYYRVYAFNLAGNSTYSGVATATTQNPPTTPPSAPSNLVATAISATAINLSWNESSSDESGFKIERAPSSSDPFELIFTTGAGITDYANTGLSAATPYYYRISAYNGAGSSALTSVASATTQASVPTAPSNLVATATSSAQINLVWTDNSAVETGFKIERATSASGPFSLIYSTAADATSYGDSGLSVASTYYYRIYAVNASGSSNFSSITSATSFGTYTWLINNFFANPSRTNYCTSCHSGAHPPTGYGMDSYIEVITAVTSGNATGSLLYQRVLDTTMPQGGPALSSSELNALKTWIDSGAANN
jgi:hypothetical protein